MDLGPAVRGVPDLRADDGDARAGVGDRHRGAVLRDHLDDEVAVARAQADVDVAVELLELHLRDDAGGDGAALLHLEPRRVVDAGERRAAAAVRRRRRRRVRTDDEQEQRADAGGEEERELEAGHRAQRAHERRGRKTLIRPATSVPPPQGNATRGRVRQRVGKRGGVKCKVNLRLRRILTLAFATAVAATLVTLPSAVAEEGGTKVPDTYLEHLSQSVNVTLLRAASVRRAEAVLARPGAGSCGRAVAHDRTLEPVLRLEREQGRLQLRLHRLPPERGVGRLMPDERPVRPRVDERLRRDPVQRQHHRLVVVDRRRPLGPQRRVPAAGDAERPAEPPGGALRRRSGRPSSRAAATRSTPRASRTTRRPRRSA